MLTPPAAMSDESIEFYGAMGGSDVWLEGSANEVFKQLQIEVSGMQADSQMGLWHAVPTKD